MFFYWDIVLIFFMCAYLLFLYFIWKETATVRNELETLMEMIRDMRIRLKILDRVTHGIKAFLDESRVDSILAAGQSKKRGRPKKPQTFDINIPPYKKDDSK